MACLLLGLPNELLLQIIHSVANADLDSFTSTCKTLRSLADDALRGHRARKAMYAHITYGDPEENDPRTTWVHPTLILRDLLRDDLFPTRGHSPSMTTRTKVPNGTTEEFTVALIVNVLEIVTLRSIMHYKNFQMMLGHLLKSARISIETTI